MCFIEIFFFTDCANYREAPISILPQQNLTILTSSLGAPLNVSCEAFFGDLNEYNCGDENLSSCAIGWNAEPDIIEANGEMQRDANHRVHAVVTR